VSLIAWCRSSILGGRKGGMSVLIMLESSVTASWLDCQGSVPCAGRSSSFLRPEVVSTVTIKDTVFWYVRPKAEVCLCFRETHCLHLQG
jgi:hypothetical protein